ncbi:MAG: hypothetical protein GXY53_08825 [Desulfobulbus sp.]|nr:hypothetical protein [Desulfobulbus sp.]
MKASQPKHFIYIVGEQQEGIVPESTEIFTFTKQSMQQIETAELALVIANVFARNQFFPGPDGALTSVIHEFVARSEKFQHLRSRYRQGRCTLVTALKRLDGEISVKVSAVFPVKAKRLAPQDPESFRSVLIESLPGFQTAFTEEAYAPDSKIIDIIKQTTLHHIQTSLQ